ncbi:hypothetical protein HAALTHF_02000n [Vreelandella aquamarina]|nr:hypothetical protein HAALTHF_02000n [Halomonas axialensis]
MRLFETRPGDDGLPGPERLLAVLALVTGTLMAVVDTTMINLALPTIAADLNVPASRAVWITNLFQVVCCVLTGICGHQRAHYSQAALLVWPWDVCGSSTRGGTVA